MTRRARPTGLQCAHPTSSCRRSIPPAWRFWRDRAGTSLLEVLICSTVVGIGALGLALMFGTGQAVITAEGDNRVAVYLAQQRIEWSRAQGFTSPANVPGTTTETLDEALRTPSGPSDPVAWTRTTVIACVDSNDYSSAVDCTATPAPARRVTVTVQSTPGNQADRMTRSVTLRSILTDR